MRVYTIVFGNVSVAAQQDLFSIRPVADKPIKLLGCEISNVGADVGDAAEEMLRLVIVRGNTTIGSGGTNPTANKVREADTTFGPTTNVRVNDTTKVSGGTGKILLETGFNVRVGWLWIPIVETRFECTNTDGFIALQLATTPADAVSLSGTLTIGEES